MSLTAEQYRFLTAALVPSRVAKDPKGNSHLEAWDVRRHLIRFFGFGGWDFTVVECALVKELEQIRRRKNQQGQEYGDPYTAWTVVYRVLGRLTIRTRNGGHLCAYEDGATGDAVNQPSLGDAHDMALKTAMSQALKRCAVNLGDQFGLSLYHDGSTTATVQRSLVAPEEDDGDSTSDSDRGGASAEQVSAGAGLDGEGAGERGPESDNEASPLRPGVQPAVHQRDGVSGSTQASRDDRGARAEVGGRRE